MMKECGQFFYVFWQIAGFNLWYSCLTINLHPIPSYFLHTLTRNSRAVHHAHWSVSHQNMSYVISYKTKNLYVAFIVRRCIDWVLNCPHMCCDCMAFTYLRVLFVIDYNVRVKLICGHWSLNHLPVLIVT